LGWKPKEYYLSSPYEFFAACEGYFDKIEHNASMLRLASYRIHQSLVGKDALKISDYWPLSSDKPIEQKRIVVTKEKIAEILAFHNQ
jgi:hypothetical protein